MSKGHEETLKKYCSCDTCGTYFGTRHLLTVYNETKHNLDVLVDDSSEAESEVDNHECEQCHLKFITLNELQKHIQENHDRKRTKKKQKKDKLYRF